MVKIIVAKEKHNCEHLLGTFLDESHYDILVEEDTDCFSIPSCDLSTVAACQPQTDCATCEKGIDERRVAFKFRKNFFSVEEQKEAYEGLRAGATETQNRGLAAGPREGTTIGRDWVSLYELEVLNYLIEQSATLFDESELDSIKKKYAGREREAGSDGIVWLTNKTRDWKFDTWLEEVVKLPMEEQIKQAKMVNDVYMSSTRYAAPVLSGVAGFFDRYVRIPYGRETSYTRNHREQFNRALPFLQTLNKGFKELLPWRWGNQKAASDKVDPRFIVEGTVFSTITVNNTFRTAAHRDAGDFSDGLSNLLVLSNDGNYTGGYLIFPEYRVAVNVRPGDLLLVNNHEIIHGNTPIVPGTPESERISLVCYLREGMLDLGSKEYEDCRYNFVEHCRLNKDHKFQRERWNGIYPGMWTGKEWYDYAIAHLGRDEVAKYDPDVIAANEVANLDEFFG